MKRWEKYEEFLHCGDWHMHTAYTDGENTVMEMCEQAVKNNLKLIAFTEHVRKELDYDFDEFLRDINNARKKFPQIKILAGCEASVIDTEGNLDVSEDVLKKCEIVIASFHKFPFAEKHHYILAIENMIRNPVVDIWGHPTQGFIERGIKLTQEEVDRIIELCKKHKVLIERSEKYTGTHWFVNRAAELGAKIVFSSDAHSVRDIRKLVGTSL